MSGQAWFTLAVVLAVIALLVSERFSPPLVLLGAITLLLAAGVVDADEALSGFSNPAPFTVAALYVLAAAAEKTRVLDRVTERMLEAGRPDGRGGQLRILAPTAAASAFLNNTPIVAMVAPSVAAWARRTGRSPSRYLLPVSFAAILGGVVTLVGTSTNLVVSGLLQDSGRSPIGLFELTWVGLPVAVVGLVFLAFGAPSLLPTRRAPSERYDEDAREFTVEALVERASPLAGLTVADAGLRNLEGVFLVDIERGGRRIAPVSPDEELAEDDRLTFAGNVQRILDLQHRPGLVSAEERHFVAAGAAPNRRLYEAVIAEGSPLTGATLKDVGFRGRYGAAVMAIHRADERLAAKLGEVPLRPGDVLLVLADRGFRRRGLAERDFSVVAPLEAEPPARREKAWVVAAVIAGLFAVVGTGALDILPAALLAAFALVLLGVLSAGEARDAVDLNVVLVIAASFGLGAAMTASRLAGELAERFVEPFERIGDVGLLVGILVATVLLTELITNNAAAVLMFPIGIATAEQAGLDPRGFAVAIAVGASCSFLTPIGYQTNTMVYGMGGYRFGDFARVGFPLTLLVVVAAAAIIPLVWPLR